MTQRYILGLLGALAAATLLLACATRTAPPVTPAVAPVSPTATAAITASSNVTTTASPANTVWQTLPQQMIDGVAFRHYATVNRTDGTYRQMFIDEATLSTWTPGQPLPVESFLVMETYYSPQVESTNFTKAMSIDGFHYGSFSPSRPSFTTQPDNSCAACHGRAEDAAGTFTLAMLTAARQTGAVATTLCDQGGRTPCTAEVYREFVELLEGEK